MTVTLQSPDIAQALEEAFPFEVRKHRLVGPDNTETPHYGLFRDSDWKCVGAAVSSRYHPHTREHVQILAEAATVAMEELGGAAHVSCAWRDGHDVIIRGSEDTTSAPIVGDRMRPQVHIRAPYDGRAFSAEFQVWRLVCSNGLGRWQKHRHTIRHSAGSFRDRFGSLVKEFRKLVGTWTYTQERIEAAADRTVNMADFLREVYPMTERPTERQFRAHERRVAAIMARMVREQRQLGNPVNNYRQVSAWTAYNAVQGYVQHEARRKGNPSPIERELIARDDPAVERAAELALSV